MSRLYELERIGALGGQGELASKLLKQNAAEDMYNALGYLLIVMWTSGVHSCNGMAERSIYYKVKKVLDKANGK